MVQQTVEVPLMLRIQKLVDVLVTRQGEQISEVSEVAGVDEIMEVSVQLWVQKIGEAPPILEISLVECVDEVGHRSSRPTSFRGGAEDSEVCGRDDDAAGGADLRGPNG